MVPLVILPMVPLAYQLYHWLTNGSNCTIGRANGTIGIAIGTNGITNGTIGKTLNDIGIPLVTLGNPEHTRLLSCHLTKLICTVFIINGYFSGQLFRILLFLKLKLFAFLLLYST